MTQARIVCFAIWICVSAAQAKLYGQDLSAPIPPNSILVLDRDLMVPEKTISLVFEGEYKDVTRRPLPWNSRSGLGSRKPVCTLYLKGADEHRDRIFEKGWRLIVSASKPIESKHEAQWSMQFSNPYFDRLQCTVFINWDTGWDDGMDIEYSLPTVADMREALKGSCTLFVAKHEPPLSYYPLSMQSLDATHIHEALSLIPEPHQAAKYFE